MNENGLPTLPSREPPLPPHTLQQAVGQSPLTVLITDSDGHIVYANAHLTELTGYTLDEVKGLTLRIFNSSRTDPLVYDEMWATIKAGRTWQGVLHNRKKNDELFWENISIAPVFDEQQVITHFIAFKTDITRQRRAEDQLRESEMGLRMLVNSTDDIVFTLDILQRHTGVYGRWLEHSGMQPQDFIGRTAREVLGDSAALVHEEANARALAGDSVVYEWSAGDRHLQTSLAPIHASDGSVAGLVGIGRDVTWQRAAEQQLRESERFARSAIDSLSAQIAILDEHGVIIAVNEAWRRSAETYGASPESVGEGISYLGVIEHVEPTDADWRVASAFKEAILGVIRGDITTFTLEYPCETTTDETKTGVRWFTGRITRFAGEGPLRVVIAHEDTTKQKQAELAMQKANHDLDTLHRELAHQNQTLEDAVGQRTEELRLLNERMETILDHISDAIIVLDNENRLQDINRAFTDQFGYTRDEAAELMAGILVDAPDVPVLIKAIHSTRTTSTSQRIQIVARHRDGSLFDADFALGFVENNADHIVCSVRDITHLKEVERVKDQFVSMVSHELRTPVSSIMLSAETITRYYDRLSDEQKIHKLEQIRQQAATLTELMSSILDIARSDARRTQAAAEKSDLVQILGDTAAELRPQADNNRQQLQITTGVTSLMVPCEHTDMIRVWRNLISNAIKYAGEDRLITAGIYNTLPRPPENVAALLPDLPFDHTGHDYAIGIVSDNGLGIREQDIPHLFTRFFRGWAAGTSIPGTGLGLSLVRDILRSYGGDINVRTEQGLGTTFCFWVPLMKGITQ
jgi:two-component system NtrC family sensor kinase